MYAIGWERGLIFRLNGLRWTIADSDGPLKIFAKRHSDASHERFFIPDLIRWMGDGTLIIESAYPQNRPEQPDNLLSWVNPKYVKIAEQRREILKPVLNKAAVPNEELAALAVTHQSSLRTLRRWWRDYQKRGLEGLVPCTALMRQRAINFPDQRFARIFWFVVNEHYLTPRAPNKHAAVQMMKAEVTKANIIELPLIIVPPRSTLYLDLKRIHPSIEALRREGLQAFENNFLLTPTQFSDRCVRFPTHIIEIDHTLLDLELRDPRTNIPLGRPWLTLAFDVYSRLPWGYYLSLDHPSATSLMMVMRHGVQLKRAKEFYETDREWSAFGIPSIVIVDNGKDFRSHHFRTMCAELGVTIHYRPRRTPRFGAVIERMFGTINQQLLHNALGNTKTMVKVKMKNRNPREETPWTPQLLDIALNVYFTQIYPLRAHKGLDGQLPANQWDKGLLFTGHPRFPNDLPAFYRATLPVVERTVTRMGIELHHHHYSHPLLAKYVGLKQRVKVKWDPLDLSYIEVLLPKEKIWVTASAQSKAAHKMSYLDYRLTKKLIAHENGLVNLESLFSGWERIHNLEQQGLDEREEIQQQLLRREASRKLLDGGGPSPKESSTSSIDLWSDLTVLEELDQFQGYPSM
ncbi:MAG: transposase [Nitrospira sp.]|nr:transposase [Nitrospira sp.]